MILRGGGVPADGAILEKCKKNYSFRAGWEHLMRQPLVDTV